MAARVEALEAERAMRDLQRRFDGDAYCADCGVPSPEFVNLTVGAFICKTCATIHRAISNRRIKDIYTGELTMEDVRRMAQVGGENSACNDRVNRRFLHLWDPREFPQPEPDDEERLRNFIWLKYEGSWKKSAQARAPPAPPQQQDPYSRERELFRNTRSNSGTSQPQPLARANWAERLGHAAPQHQEQPRFVEPGHAPDRFVRNLSRDRFNPPSATAYGRRPESNKAHDRAGGPPARYREDYEEEYERRGDRRRESNRGDTRERTRDREREREPERGRDRERDRERERGRSRSYRSKKGARHTTDSERDEESDEEVVERRRTRTTKERRDYEDSVDDSSEADDYASRKKKISKQKKRDARRKHKRRDDDMESDDEDADSLPSTVGSARLPNAGEPVPTTTPAKPEFDLMSDWMGSNDAATTQTATSATQAQVPVATAGTAPIAPQMSQSAAQPMNMYSSMVANPAAAYMTAYYPMGVGIPMMPMGMPPPMANVVGGMASMSLAPQTQAQVLAAQHMQQSMQPQQQTMQAQQPQHPMAAQQAMHLQAQHAQAQQPTHTMMQQPVPGLPSSVGTMPPAAGFQPPPTMATYQGAAPPPPPTIAAYQGPAPPPPPGPPPA